MHLLRDLFRYSFCLTFTCKKKDNLYKYKRHFIMKNIFRKGRKILTKLPRHFFVIIKCELNVINYVLPSSRANQEWIGTK